jgi:hypothetical protein
MISIQKFLALKIWWKPLLRKKDEKFGYTAIYMDTPKKRIVSSMVAILLQTEVFWAGQLLDFYLEFSLKKVIFLAIKVADLKSNNTNWAQVE